MGTSKADRILREIEKMTETRFLPIIGPRKGQILAELLRQTKPKRILEIGTLIGYSAIVMAKELESDAEIITIEIHKDEAGIAKDNIRRAEVSPRIDVLIGDALEVIPTLRGMFDLVFLDATRSEYLDYLKLVEDKLHQGSVIVADNAGIFAASMSNYLDYMRKSGKYRSRFAPANGDGMEISTRL